MCLHPFLFILVWWLCPDFLYAAITCWQERGLLTVALCWRPVCFSLWSKWEAGNLESAQFLVVWRGGGERGVLSQSRTQSLLEYLCMLLSWGSDERPAQGSWHLNKDGEEDTIHLFQGGRVTQALDQFLKLECCSGAFNPLAESAPWITLKTSPISPQCTF